VHVIATSDKDKPIEEQGLPAELQRAIIACNGKLTPKFEYIPALRAEVLENILASSKKPMQNTQEFAMTN
jgi:hypothetical protein